MILPRLIGLSVLCASLALLGGCNKEQPAAPSTAPAPAPASAPAPAPAPESSAPPASTPAANISAAPAGGAVSEQAAHDILSKSGCLACHAVDKKLVGPAYKDVANKYRGQPDAEAKLMQKVKNGGSGVWGQVPMPPNGQVPDADVHALVKWILSQK
jgi:cytochrome c